MTLRLWLPLLAVVSAPSLGAQPDGKSVAFFESSIRPLLAGHCWSCHSSKARISFAGLRLDSAAGLQKGADSGPVVIPGKPGESRLLRALLYDANPKMPPAGKLKPEQVEAVRQWIAMGAPWPAEAPPAPAESKTGNQTERSKHWAWQPVHRPVIPSVRNAAWARDPVDHFILAALDRNQWIPAPDAARHTWLRRVSLDLTGLPPSAAEAREFLADSSPQAEARAVDRLLDSPGFGEQWGRHWLDQTYFADNIEIGRRVPAIHAWRYRDYVVDALQRDVPYDRFIHEQLAGDQLDAADPAQRRRNLIATGFLALGPWALVTADKEQLRMDVVDLQLDMVGKTFLGLTMGCARCHDHKFDPISLQDYYGMAGIFRSTQTLSGRLGLSVFSNVNTVALPEFPEEMERRATETRQYEQKLAARRRELADLEQRRKEPGKPAAGEAAPERKHLDDRIRDLQNEVKLLEFLPPVPPAAHAVQDVETPADCRINLRGNPHQLGPEVPRHFVAAAMTGPMPDVADWRSGRKELAAWIASPRNPLTARVAVNRIWHHLFGAGLFRTIDNAGLRGDRPSHPQLLDFLAAEFMDQGWSVKKLIRRIVLTRTYRMASTTNAKAMELDPENRLLWRMNRRRLEAESIRDSMLAVSGALDPAQGGPSLPLWVPGNLNLGGPQFLKDDARLDPATQRRRSVWLPVLRKSQLAELDVLNLFNFPDVNQITGARAVTTTPTQALYLMNAPFVREQAVALADAILAAPARDDADRIAQLVFRVYSRLPEPGEGARLAGFVRAFADNRAGSGKAQEALREAWIRLCHTLLASNEFLYRS